MNCLILDRDPEHEKTLSDFVSTIGFEVMHCRDVESASDALETDAVELAFIDLDSDAQDHNLSLLESDKLDGTEVLVMSSEDDPLLSDRAVRLGASYYFCKPMQPEKLKSLLVDLVAEIESQRDGPPEKPPCAVDQFGLLRGSSRGMRKLYRQLRKITRSDASLLVVGESGTGKELVAHTVHLLSDRADGPFIAFNCAAIPPDIAESELFGHEKGSFSGATRRHRGYFERAAGGTLLLDEITEMAPELQVKLLRVLETRRLRRVGSEEEIGVDCRIVSAANRSPERAVAEGALREDLYYRLAQFPLKVPPLRNREGDRVGLAHYFLNELNLKHDTAVTFSSAALETIDAHDWPGNVRQLKHAVERAYILSEVRIDADVMPQPNQGLAGTPTVDEDDVVEVEVGTSIAEMERRLIEATLAKNNDDKKITAAELGISLKTLYNRLQDYDSGSKSTGD